MSHTQLRAIMAQPQSWKRPPAGARMVVVRGPSHTHVAAAVRELVGGGPLAPAGPYRYPFAAVVQLLRESGLFQDPSTDSVPNPLISGEALRDMLWELMRRGGRCGFTCADGLDAASAALLRDYADVGRLAVAYGLEAGGTVMGSQGCLPAALQLPSAELRDVPDTAPPQARLSPRAARVLALIESAPHPVSPESLMQLAGGDPSAALRELASAGMVDIGARLGLATPGLAGPQAAWLETPETRLPLASLSVGGDASLARHLAEASLYCGDHEIAAYCAAWPGADPVVAALAAARCGRFQLAHAMLQQAPHADALRAGRVAALLVAPGLVSAQEADARLRAAERAGHAVAARAARATLLLETGSSTAAHNLLRRTTRAELEKSPPEVVLEHELVLARCTGKLRRPAETRLLCSTRRDHRQLARRTGEDLLLAAADFDVAALQRANPQAAGAALAKMMSMPQPAPAASADPLATLFARLRERGATLLAARAAGRLVLHPAAAAARPGLAATMEARLARLAEMPGAVGFGRDEFARMGPYSGGSALVVREFGHAGPLIAVFRAGSLPEVRDLLRP